MGNGDFCSRRPVESGTDYRDHPFVQQFDYLKQAWWLAPITRLDN